MRPRQLKTGIFLPYYQGERLKDFPYALAGILDKNNITFYDGRYRSTDIANHITAATEDQLSRVHSGRMIEKVKMTRFFEAAVYSAGGTIHAAEEMLKGNIDNAFVFTGVGDHHAGRDFFGGYCYFNGAAVAVALLRDKGISRFAIVDTDSHHADGTRDIFHYDRDVLHICFCHQDYQDSYNNIDIFIPYNISDEVYLHKFRQKFVPTIKAFRPEIIFWEFGYDATQGEYGDKGLTGDCHLEILKTIKASADETCQGRLVVILCGGSGRRLATYIIPRIIGYLAEQNIFSNKE